MRITLSRSSLRFFRILQEPVFNTGRECSFDCASLSNSHVITGRGDTAGGVPDPGMPGMFCRSITHETRRRPYERQICPGIRPLGPGITSMRGNPPPGHLAAAIYLVPEALASFVSIRSAPDAPCHGSSQRGHPRPSDAEKGCPECAQIGRSDDGAHGTLRIPHVPGPVVAQAVRSAPSFMEGAIPDMRCGAIPGRPGPGLGIHRLTSTSRDRPRVMPATRGQPVSGRSRSGAAPRPDRDTTGLGARRIGPCALIGQCVNRVDGSGV